MNKKKGGKKVSGFEQGLLAEFLNSCEEQYRIITGKPFSKQDQAKIRKRFDDMMAFKDLYCCYVRSDCEVQKSFVAIKAPDMEVGEGIFFQFYNLGSGLLNQTQIEHDISDVRRALDGKRLAITIGLNPSQEKFWGLLRKARFQFLGYQMIGQVDQGIRLLSAKARGVGKRYCVDLLGESDVDSYLKLEIMCHRRDETSRIHHIAYRLLKSEMFKRYFFEEIILKRSGFVIRDRGKIIASISFFEKRGGVPRMGYIGSLSVHPEYQGQGISYLLYWNCLHAMKRRGIAYYGGTTTTKKVLGLSKKIGRKPTLTFWRRFS